VFHQSSGCVGCAILELILEESDTRFIREYTMANRTNGSICKYMAHDRET
jgi:hypothetical protein